MAQSIVDKLFALEKSADRELSKHSVFLQLERSTGLKKTSLVALGTASILFILAFRCAAHSIVALVSFVYPAVMTVMVIEQHNKADDANWMAYWLTLGLLTTIESITGRALYSIIPFYLLIKLAFCVWLFLPRTSGAKLLYEKTIRPMAYALKDNAVAKDLVAKMQKSALEFGKVAAKKVSEAKSAASKIPATKETNGSSAVEEKDD